MTRWSWMISAALAGATLTLPSSARADQGEHNEKVVSLDKIPSAARATILREAAGAPVLKVEEETEHDKTVYEAYVKKGGEEIGISVDAKGALLGTHPEKSEKKESNHKGR